MRNFGIFVFVIALTGCEGLRLPMPYTCSGGNGFVNQICSAPALEPGALEIGVELDSREYLEVCWHLEYDRTGSNLVGDWCSPVIAGSSVISTPEAIGEGDLDVEATAYTPTGLAKSLFCGGDSADTYVYAELNHMGLDVDRSSGSTCLLRVDLDDYLNN